jgi:hypothetical protein
MKYGYNNVDVAFGRGGIYRETSDGKRQYLSLNSHGGVDWQKTPYFLLFEDATAEAIINGLNNQRREQAAVCEIGDYCLATKYSDGDPSDHFAVGFLQAIRDYGQGPRYILVDENEEPFRATGFRWCRKITTEQGRWVIENADHIEKFPFRTDFCDLLTGKSVVEWMLGAVPDGTP